MSWVSGDTCSDYGLLGDSQLTIRRHYCHSEFINQDSSHSCMQSYSSSTLCAVFLLQLRDQVADLINKLQQSQSAEELGEELHRLKQDLKTVTEHKNKLAESKQALNKVSHPMSCVVYVLPCCCCLMNSLVL